MLHAQATPMSAVSEDHREALQEIMNVAIGRSSSALAVVLDAFVVLSVPRIRLVEMDELYEHLFVDFDDVAVVEQMFHGDITGQGFVRFSKQGLLGLLPQIFSQEEIDGLGQEQAEREVLLEVGNLVLSAATGTCAELLHGRLTFCAPQVMPPEAFALDDKQNADRRALVMETDIHTEDGHTRALVALVQDPSTNEWLLQALDSFIEELFG